MYVYTYTYRYITIYLFIYPSICLSIYLSESIQVLLTIVFDYNPSQCVGSDLSPSFCVRWCCLPTTFKITPTKQMLASLGFSSSKQFVYAQHLCNMNTKALICNVHIHIYRHMYIYIHMYMYTHTDAQAHIQTCPRQHVALGFRQPQHPVETQREGG